MNIYMYPISDPKKSNTNNPYINNLIGALEEENCIVVNKNRIQRYGILDILFNIRQVDVYYFNWIENLPDRRFGKIQCFLFYIIFLILKIFNKKIVWMMHNKISHSKKGLFCKIITTYFLVNYSDFVFTHAQDGVHFGNTFLKSNKQIHFFHHPIDNRLNLLQDKSFKKYDILIWGSIIPYKGIDSFLKYLENNALLTKFNICIIGKVSNQELAKELDKYNSNNISIINDYASQEYLEELFSQSKIVLFTYAGYSTLSSGALMDTLSYGNRVIGPDIGVFRDLNKEGLVETYQGFDELSSLLDEFLTKNNFSSKYITKFIEHNLWQNLGKNICNTIKDFQKVK
ncbi:MAG TPA: glycosyltransferase family 1 protein [Arcobacter sp.]|nr:glycosyltransferase family 1 protein [Arcobacter sp.]